MRASRAFPRSGFNGRLFDDRRFLLSSSPSFGFGAVFKDSIAGCLAVAVRDDHAKIMVFRLAPCVVLFRHEGF
jgi:hypothetical protein